MPFDAVGSLDRPTEDQVRALVTELGLLEDPLLVGQIQFDTDAGIYQLATVPTVLLGYGLDRFLRPYLKRFPPRDPRWREALRTGLNTLLDAAFQPAARDLHMRVIKDGFNRDPVSLTALTREICSEEDANFSRVRARVRERFLVPLHTILLWEVEERRANRRGVEEPASYRIKIGEAALHYHSLVFKPIMIKHLNDYRGSIGP